MATFNFTSSTNNVNPVLWSFGTKLEYHTDRESGSFARGALVDAVNNLGVGVAAGEPFTLLS
jgi:hypothetical protein